MNIKRILLTGDDGYNSIGTRIVAHYLKNKYELTIVGTKDQQSAVGGKLNLKTPMEWKKEKVDGVVAYCVDGSPVDAIEFTSCKFKSQFDLVISGINWGVNIGGGIISSGTFSAAFRAMGNKLAKKAIVLSWDIPGNDYFRKHDHNTDDLSEFLKYPGKVANKIVVNIIENDFYDSQIVNVNFPKKITNKVRFTKPLDNLSEFYDNSNTKHIKEYKEGNSGTFSLAGNDISTKLNKDINIDTGAVLKGYISLTLMNDNLLNTDVYPTIKNKQFTL